MLITEKWSKFKGGMNSNRIIRFIVLALLILTSCYREVLDEKTIIIQNSLDMEVSLKFYERGVPLRITNFTIDGPGRIFERTLELQGVVTETDVLGADSILIIFEGQDFEIHATDNRPRGNSLFNGSSYQRESENVVLYTIDEKNLSNAVPCEGNCQ
jgi:hypothetical protein